MAANTAIRHLLDVDEWSLNDIQRLLDMADSLRGWSDPNSLRSLLRDTVVVTLFYENSTRTRVSFELAAKALGADVVNISASASSVTKGETIRDTVNTLDALGADIIVMRHEHSGAPNTAARWSSSSIINAGDGWRAHPSQALLDLLTLRSIFGSAAGKKIVIAGDIIHSRVARSNIYALTTAGAEVILCGPPTMLPQTFTAAYPGRNVSVTYSIDEALANADAVMALRIQKERMTGGALPSLREYRQFFGLTAERMKAYPHLPILHPGPMNEGVEIDPEVAHGAQSYVERQVANGPLVRMAILLWAARKDDAFLNMAPQTRQIGRH